MEDLFLTSSNKEIINCKLFFNDNVFLKNVVIICPSSDENLSQYYFLNSFFHHFIIVIPREISKYVGDISDVITFVSKYYTTNIHLYGKFSGASAMLYALNNIPNIPISSLSINNPCIVSPTASRMSERLMAKISQEKYSFGKLQKLKNIPYNFLLLLPYDSHETLFWYYNITSPKKFLIQYSYFHFDEIKKWINLHD